MIEISGAFFVDKPVGPTSRAVLDTLEAQLDLGPMGHTGTLDPLASGLLVALVGTARKLQEMFTASTKVYHATLRLGWTSATLDGEGPLERSDRPLPNLEGTTDELWSPFVGDIEQIPPVHSALRVAGRRAWQFAREGHSPKLHPRRVCIESIETLSVQDDLLELSVRCSKGTYVRSLARDLGEHLGSGAYLHALRRISSGPFLLESALPPESLSMEHLQPLTTILAFWPRIDVGLEEAERLFVGAPIERRLTEPERPTFAWYRGEPLCRLRVKASGLVRSELRLQRELDAN